MKSPSLFLLVVLLVSVPGFGTDHPRPLAAARTLLQGVGPLVVDGQPGRLGLTGPQLFPLLEDPEGNDAAAVYDDGRARAVFLTHDVWFQASARTGAQARFLDNVTNWLTKEHPRGRVLCFGTLDLGSLLASRGLAVDTPDRFPSDLSGYDAVFVSLPNEWTPAFDRRSARALRAAFDGGTPVLAMGMGWVWRTYGEGAKGGDLASDFSANAVFADRGLLFSEEATGSQLGPVDPVPASYRNLSLWTRALGALEGRTEGLDASFPAQVYDALEFVTDWHQILSEAELGALASRLNGRGRALVPTTDHPVPMADVAARTAMVVTELVSRRHPELFRPLYPLIGEFPGNGSPWSAQTVPLTTVKTVPRASGGGWQTMGVYARAGETVSVQVDGLAPGEAAWVQLGAHIDTLERAELDQLERWPWVAQRYGLTDGTVRFLCRVSGPVYLEVPTQTQGDLRVTVSGGMAMPVYRPGTDPRAFLSEVKNSTCPLVEVGGRFLVFTQPRETLPPNFDPVRVTAWWDRVATLGSQLLGENPGPRPQRYVADRQIALGYMHSGYPIMTFLDVAGFQMGGPGPDGQDLYREGSWGHFHELGHNLQSEAWTFSNAGEVTVNLFSLYIMDKLVGIRPLVHPALTEHAEAISAYLARPDWAHWSNDPFVALQTYAVLADRFGWEPFTRTFQAYAALADDRLPRTDLEKVNRWVLEFSRQTKTNLVPYFRQWGWPVDAGTEKALASFPIGKGADPSPQGASGVPKP